MSTAEGTQAIHAAFPNGDILVNNVGGYGSRFVQSTDEDWYRLIDLNVMSAEPLVYERPQVPGQPSSQARAYSCAGSRSPIGPLLPRRMNR